jgi:hypothetical protein
VYAQLVPLLKPYSRVIDVGPESDPAA